MVQTQGPYHYARKPIIIDKLFFKVNKNFDVYFCFLKWVLLCPSSRFFSSSKLLYATTAMDLPRIRGNG